MGSPNIKTLLNRYWSADSTTGEENLLKDKFRAIGQEEEKKYEVLFDYIDKTMTADEQTFDLSFLPMNGTGEVVDERKPWKQSLRWSMGIAATILLALFSVMYQWPHTETLTTQKKEMERAYTETLAVLDRVASTLQTGNASILEIGVFDKTKKQITDVQR